MPGTDLFDRVRPLLRESETELDRGEWLIDAADREVIAALLPSLDTLAQQRAEQPSVDRGPLVRDAATDLATWAARASGRLAWLLLGTTRALEPFQHGGSPADAPAGDGSPADAPAVARRLGDAEHVLLRLRTVLCLARAYQVAHP